MKKRIFLLIALSLLFIPIISALVNLNEIEINPPGSDAGNEWIELFSSIPTNLSNWYIQDKDSNNYTLPDTTISNFFALENLSGLDNLNQEIKLFNKFNLLQDSILLNDTSDNDATFSRLPDGSGDFVFQASTKALPNEPVLIENKSVSAQCILSSNNVTLNVQVSGFCIQEIIFSAQINNIWQNFSGVNTQGNNYSAKIPSSFFSGNEQINWTVFAMDCFNRTFQDGIENFFVNSKTLLLTIPPSPDGLNSWYITEPLFILSNQNAQSIFYRWDANGIFNYTAPFGLENAPNSGNITAGILDLNYWSDICNEPIQTALLKVDLTNPLITDLHPANNSFIFNKKPVISALLDEIYQSNSGIDKSSIVMLLDDLFAPVSIFNSGDLDAVVRHNPLSDLSEGKHNVTIIVSDNAGRNSKLTWIFLVNLTSGFNLTINSPTNQSYNTRRIPFNVTTTHPALLEYINHNDRRPRWNNLCRNCDEYGLRRHISKNLNEGWNNITIRATDDFGNIKEIEVMLFIDSKQPNILTIYPRRNSVINGSLFSLKYTEDNLKSILLFFNPNITLQNCSSGKDKICGTSANLSAFDNQFIDFYFEVSDEMNTFQSRTTRVLVDTISPNLKIYQPLNKTFNRKVPFNITISEPVFLEYYDKSNFSPRWRRLCSGCDEYGFFKIRTKTFKSGFHDLLIKATDPAGNSNIKQTNFTIV